MCVCFALLHHASTQSIRHCCPCAMHIVHPGNYDQPHLCQHGERGTARYLPWERLHHRSSNLISLQSLHADRHVISERTLPCPQMRHMVCSNPIQLFCEHTKLIWPPKTHSLNFVSVSRQAVQHSRSSLFLRMSIDNTNFTNDARLHT